MSEQITHIFRNTVQVRAWNTVFTVRCIDWDVKISRLSEQYEYQSQVRDSPFDWLSNTEIDFWNNNISEVSHKSEDSVLATRKLWQNSVLNQKLNMDPHSKQSNLKRRTPQTLTIQLNQLSDIICHYLSHCGLFISVCI